jgi:modulator of FtsH protease
MDKWANFFICVGAAGATLTGLIFVGVSISLERILSLSALPARALSALVLLTNIVIVAALGLVPEPMLFVGIEILVICVIACWITLSLDISAMKATGAEYKILALRNVFFTQVTVIPLLIGSVLLITGNICGCYFLVPGIILAIVKAVLDAWVLLIEIHR